jgi:hypothetical protein
MGASLTNVGMALALTASPGLGADKIVPETLTWGLTKTVVVDPGTRSVTAEGTLVRGYVIESKAKEKDSKLVPEGTFRLELSAFQPSLDMAGQEAGRWYVQGKWSVIDKRAPEETKHSRGVMSGFIGADLGFNPTADQSSWSADAGLPMSTVTAATNHGVQWARGDGVLTLDPTMEGELQLNLQLYPVLPAAD